MNPENQKTRPGEDAPVSNFIRTIINEDLSSGKTKQVATRFPPEPNGFLHIGHAKSICLNFGLAQDYANATCVLRFDDTNPLKEDTQYMEAIKKDVQWLGFKWKDMHNASDYFEKLYNYAIELIKQGKAYVCELSAEELREYRGTLKQAGKNSPYRERSIEENLDLFERMRAGEFADGSRLLRAKIDMASGNINMRDPAIYRIRKTSHHRTGDQWCIYPMYDFAHCISDYIEGISHSLCTLEFQDHRPLYDWYLEQLTPEQKRPRQFEFARLNLNYTVTSKRRLKALIDLNKVDSWSDPRMPTIVGLRRRGFTPRSIRNFCERIGVAKKETTIDMSMLEDELRNDLNIEAKRAMAVLKPLKLVIDNYPEGKHELLNLKNHPQNPEMGTRPVYFAKEIYIEHDDFMETPPPKYFRLSPGKEVRLRYSYVIKCTKVVKDPATGAITQIHAEYDPNTLGKKPEGRKVKGIIHWVAKDAAVDATVNLYDRLFNLPDPTAVEKEGRDFTESLNPNSLEVLKGCKLEKSLAAAQSEEKFQFERQGYFCKDELSSEEELIFNRSVTLRDSWSK